jgi:hypothetical protein
MERYTYSNCTVVVHLPNQSTVQKETRRFLREVTKNEKEKKKE